MVNKNLKKTQSSIPDLLNLPETREHYIDRCYILPTEKVLVFRLTHQMKNFCDQEWIDKISLDEYHENIQKL